MKKETFQMLTRFLIGLAAALLMVGVVGLLGNVLVSNKPLLQQASGLNGDEVVMVVAGEDVTAEEYLYLASYFAQSLSYYGVSDLNMELGEGFTAADYVAQQTQSQCVSHATIRAWARELGITLTDEDKALMEQQKAGYGDRKSFEQTLQFAGVSEEFYDMLTGQDLIYSHITDSFCGAEGTLRADEEALREKAQEHKLVTAKVLYMETGMMDEDAKAEAQDTLEDYAQQLSQSNDRSALLDSFAEELGCSSEPQTYDACHSTPLNDALLELDEGEVSDVIEDESALYVALRRELDLDAVARVAFNEMFQERAAQAGQDVQYHDDVLQRINLSGFYTRFAAAQQKLYNRQMQG